MIKNLDELEQWIEAKLLRDQFDQVSKYVTQRAENRTFVTDLVTSIVNNDAQIQRIAEKSYSHANGFDKIVLLASDQFGFKLRLHIWWPNQKAKLYTEHIHNHRWSFSSTVITGRLKFEIFQESIDEFQVFKYKYISPEGASNYRMEFQNKEKLGLIFSEVISPPVHYTISHTVIHRVTNLDARQLTSTLMMQGRPQKVSTSVYVTRKIKNTKSLPIHSIKPTELKKKLKTYISIIS